MKLGPMTDEHKKKLSESMKHSLRAKAQRALICSTRRGMKLSEEWRRNMSLAHVGQVPWNKGKFGYRTKPATEKRKEKVRLALKGRPNPFRGIPRPPEVCAKMSKTLKGRIIDEKWRANIRKARINQVIPTKDTKPERIIQEALTVRNVQFETHKPILGQPDIFIEPNICIFIDGDYWHANPKQYSADTYISRGRFAKDIWARDARIAQQLEVLGYKVLRVWENEVLNNLDTVIGCISAMQLSSFPIKEAEG